MIFKLRLKLLPKTHIFRLNCVCKHIVCEFSNIKYVQGVSKRTTFSTTISGTKGVFFLEMPCRSASKSLILHLLKLVKSKGFFFFNIFSRDCFLEEESIKQSF